MSSEEAHQMKTPTKNPVSATKKRSLSSRKVVGKVLTSESALSSSAVSNNPINKSSSTINLKKNLPKLPKRGEDQRPSPISRDGSKSEPNIPTADLSDLPKEVDTNDMDYKEPIPPGEPIQEKKTFDVVEKSPQIFQSPTKEQRKGGSKERDPASGSGTGSMFQRGKKAASRLSDFTATVKGISNRTSADRQDTLGSVQNGIWGVAKNLKSAERDANVPSDKTTEPLTDLSALKGLEASGKRYIYDNGGNAVGTIVEGDPSELVGQVIGNDGQILDEDGDLIGVVELIGTETSQQADTIHETNSTGNAPKLENLANLPITKNGTVKDMSGQIIGQLVEGDPDDLVGETVNKNGEVLDEDGDLIGRVELMSLDEAEEAPDQAEPSEEVLLPTVASLRGKEIDKEGNILNDDGLVLGRVSEGNDLAYLSGKVPNEFGQVINSTDEIIGQIEPVPGVAANAAMQQLEESAAKTKWKDSSTHEKQDQEDSVIDEPQEPLQELPDISTLEGLRCNKFGNVVGEDGVPLGELIEGNAKELAKGGFELDDSGKFWDNRGIILGVAQTIALGEGDQRPFADFEDLVVDEEGWIQDATGARVGKVVEGEIKKVIGRAVDDDGDILDKRGNLIGHAEPWEEPEPVVEEVDFSSLEGLSPNKFGIVMGPDGVPIGRVTEGNLRKLAGRNIDDQGQIWSHDGELIGRVEPIPEHEREVPRPFSDFGDLVVRDNGFVEDESGEVVGWLIDGDPHQLRGKTVNDDGDIMDKRGNVVGRAEPYNPSEESDEPEEPEEDLSGLEGMKVKKLGNVVDNRGAIFGRLISGNPRKLNGKIVDAEGQIWSDDGKVLGNVELVPASEWDKPEGLFFGLHGLAVIKDGSVANAVGEVVGRLVEGDQARLIGRAVDEDGDIIDKIGNIIGRAERWTPEEKNRQINPMSGRKVNRDGEVRDEDGNLIGRLTSGNVKALAGKVVDDNGYFVDNDGNKTGECTLEENLSGEEEVLGSQEPELSPEEATKQAEEEHNRELAKKICGVVQQTLDSVEPLCNQITEHLARADHTPRDELDEESLVQIVKPLIKEAGNMLQECKSTIRALDPDSSIAASAKAHSSAHEATLEEYQLADTLKQLTQTVSTTIDKGRQRIADMPHAKKKLNPLWALLSEPLFQIIAAVGLLLSGILGLVNQLLSGLGLGGLVRGLLGGLGIYNLMNSFGLGDKLGIGS